MTLDTLRTPHFDFTSFGLFPQDASSLEAVSSYGQVLRGLDQWEEALVRLGRAGRMSESDEDAEYQLAGLPVGEAAVKLWKAFRALAERLKLPSPQSISLWVLWLEDLLEAVKFPKEHETAREEGAFLGLREMLRALVAGESIAGETVVGAQAFVRSLRSLLAGSNYQERERLTEKAVLVLRVLEARGLRFGAVAILGLSEGVFPETEREDPFLPEQVRDDLDLESRLGREQGGLFYQVITRADTQLLLSRPYLAKDGEYWEPSPFWNGVEELLSTEPWTVRSESPRPLSDAASPEEALTWAVRRKSIPKKFADDLIPRWEFLQHAGNILQARQVRKPDGPFEGMTPGLTEILETRYGPRHIWSPSRLETYGTCPFRFYVESVLGLQVKEPPQAGFDALQLGLILHTILEEVYGQADDPTDPQSVLGILEKIAEEVFTTAPDEFGFRPEALWEIQQEEMLSALEKTILGLAALGHGWTPIAHEKVFGIGGAPALEVSFGKEQVQIRGVIDRLDQDQDGRLRVIDYKTGSSHLGARELIDGRRLQLPLLRPGGKSSAWSGRAN